MRNTKILAYSLAAALAIGLVPIVQVDAAEETPKTEDTKVSDKTTVEDDSGSEDGIEAQDVGTTYDINGNVLDVKGELTDSDFAAITAATNINTVNLHYDIADEQKLWDAVPNAVSISLAADTDTTFTKQYKLSGKVPTATKTFNILCDYVSMDATFDLNHTQEFVYGPNYMHNYLGTATFEKEGIQNCSNFSFNEYLQSVTLPRYLSDISVHTFQGCTGLKSVRYYTYADADDRGTTNTAIGFPKKLNLISDSAFKGCASLVVSEFNSPVQIGNSAFEGCDGLTVATFNQVDQIDSYAFKDCSSLSNLTFYLSLHVPTKIDAKAFEGCLVSDLDHVIFGFNGADNHSVSEGSCGDHTCCDTFMSRFPKTAWPAILGQDVKQLTVTFYNLKAGTGQQQVVASIGEAWSDVLAKVTTKPANDNSVFEGWYTDAKFSVKASLNGNVQETDRTAYYAKWSDNPDNPDNPDTPDDPSEKKTITFIGGVTSPVEVEAYIGDAWADLTDKVDTSDKRNQRFEGWYTDAGRTKKFNATGYLKKTDPTTLYALYYNIDDPEYVYTVTIKDILGNEEKLRVNKNTTTVLTRSMLADYEISDSLVFDSWRYPAAANESRAVSTAVGEEVQFPVTLTGDLTIYSTWNARVSFDTHGGNDLEPLLVPQGSAIVDAIHRIPTPAYSGRQFDGWYMDSNYETKFNYNTVFEKNTTLHAKWTSLKYKVQFNYLISDPQVVEVESGATVAQPTTPSATDMTFQGWSTTTGSIRTPYNFATPVDKDLQLYAMWRIPVTFSENYSRTSNNNNGNNNNNNNNNNNASQDNGLTIVSVYWGDKVSQPTEPTREGNWKFGGWYTTSDCKDAFNFNTAIKTPRTLYAKWIDTTKADLKVTFNTVLDSSTTVDVKEGDVVEMPANPIHAGATFAGWYLDQGYTQKFDATQPIKNNLTVYAKWTVKVTFYPNNNTSEVTSDVLYNSTVSKVIPSAVNGYIFYNWYTDSLFGNVFDFSTKLTEDTNLYGRWVTPAEYEQLKINDAQNAANAQVPGTTLTPGTTQTPTNGSTIPKTADETPLEMLQFLFALLGAAALGVAGTMMYIKRKSS